MWRFVWTVLVVGCAGDPSENENEAPKDADDDGFDIGADCDDTDSEVHPDAVEKPYDGVDQDCSGGDLVDVDGDGFAADRISGGDDCDDDDPLIHPGAEEVPYDDIDQDCSGTDLDDVDGDGHGADDCNDADDAVHPDAEEVWYDGIDQDCRGDCDFDADHDNAVSEEWQGSIVDGSACDRDPSAEAAAPPDCDDADPSANTQQIEEIYPADGAVDVDATPQVEVTLRDSEGQATVRLLDPTGAEVPAAAFNEGGDLLVLIPVDVVSGAVDYPLAGYTTYTVEVSHSCGVETTTFTTGPGLAPVAPADLVGTTWEIAPTGIGTSGSSILEFAGWSTLALMTVTATDGVDLDLLFAVPDDDGDQDLCVPTGEALGVDFSANPVFDAGPFDLPLQFQVGPGPLTVVHEEGSVHGTFYDGDIIAMELAGFADTRPVAVAAGLGANAICNQFGCVACPDGSGVGCLDEAFSFGDASHPTDVTLVRRTAEEIAVDPGCP